MTDDRMDLGHILDCIERVEAYTHDGRDAFMVRDVPARVCPNCGEAYIEEEAATRLLTTAEQLAQSGAQVDVREYMAAQPLFTNRRRGRAQITSRNIECSTRNIEDHHP